MPGQTKKGSAVQQSLELTLADVLGAVRSLCVDDELKPFGRVILKRLRERAADAEASRQGLRPGAVDPEAMPRIDPKQLRRFCETCGQLFVQPEEGKEYSAVLKTEVFSFLDVCSQHDPYPDQLWASFATYLQNLSEGEMMLPCGRYACARQLISHQLPFLAGRSLGQVCHIVQLAVTSKRLLGHRDSQLVPFHFSEEREKEDCAIRGQPFPKKGSAPEFPVATWEEARFHLVQLLLSETGPEPGAITLSNVKRLFRSQFGLELSETSLGHARVCDLLQDPRFQDICSVDQQGNGQVMVRRVERVALRRWQPACFAFDASHPQSRMCEAGARVPPVSGPHLSPLPLLPQGRAFCLSTMPTAVVPPLMPVTSPTAALMSVASAAAAQVSPLHFPMANQDSGVWLSVVVSPGVTPRSESSPAESDIAAIKRDAACLPDWSDVASTCTDATPSDWSLLSDVDEAVVSDGIDEHDELEVVTDVASFGLVIKNTFIDVAPEECEGSARRRARSTPKSFRTSQS